MMSRNSIENVKNAYFTNHNYSLLPINFSFIPILRIIEGPIMI